MQQPPALYVIFGVRGNTWGRLRDLPTRDGRVLMALMSSHWKLTASVRRDRAALQKHCRQRQKHQVDELIQEATKHNGSVTGLHRITRRIAPKTQRRRRQLRGADGDLLSPAGQLLKIQEHFDTLAMCMLLTNMRTTLRSHAYCALNSWASSKPFMLCQTRHCRATSRLRHYGD